MEDVEFLTSMSPLVDEALGGGLRRGTTTLLEELDGEDRGVSAELGLSYVRAGLAQGEPAIVFLTEHTVGEYKQLVRHFKLDTESKSRQLIYMDALSSITLGEAAPAPTEKNVVQLSNIRYTAKFYEEFHQTVSRLDSPRIYVDSLSVLMNAMTSERTAWKFWLSLLPLIRHRKLTIISSFYPEMHSQRFVQSLERISDTIIRFTSPTPQPNQQPRHFVRIVKHRGCNFDERMLSYTHDGLEFRIKKPVGLQS